jgi:hypothetical protein
MAIENNPPSDYTKTISFWTRLEMFVHNVKVNDLAAEEEKQMILHNCKEKQKMFIALESQEKLYIKEDIEIILWKYDQFTYTKGFLIPRTEVKNWMEKNL